MKALISLIVQCTWICFTATHDYYISCVSASLIIWIYHHVIYYQWHFLDSWFKFFSKLFVKIAKVSSFCETVLKNISWRTNDILAQNNNQHCVNNDNIDVPYTPLYIILWKEIYDFYFVKNPGKRHENCEKH